MLRPYAAITMNHAAVRSPAITLGHAAITLGHAAVRHAAITLGHAAITLGHAAVRHAAITLNHAAVRHTAITLDHPAATPGGIAAGCGHPPGHRLARAACAAHHPYSPRPPAQKFPTRRPAPA